MENGSYNESGGVKMERGKVRRKERYETWDVNQNSRIEEYDEKMQ